MSRIIEEYVTPNFERLLLEINHENKSFYSTGTIELKREGILVSHLFFEVFDIHFDQSEIAIRLPQIDTLAEEDKGYGSIILRKLIEYAIKLKASKIEGGILIQGDRKKLKYFYEKNFAAVISNAGNPSSFSIDLTKPESLLLHIEKDFYKKRSEILESDNDFFRKQHSEYERIVAELAFKNRNAHWLVKFSKRIVGEEKRMSVMSKLVPKNKTPKGRLEV